MRIKQFLIFSFLSLLLMTNITLAQVDTNAVLSTISSILIQFSGIIFILVFILILLFVAGVIHFPGLGGSFIAVIIFVILIILTFLFPQFISFPNYLKEVPASFKYWALPGPAVDALQMVGIPREWGYVPAIIYLLILPFAAVFTLFWAFLQSLGIFNQPNVNRILALIVAFMTIPMGWFVKMVWALFSFMGAWSIAIFAATFIVGIFFKGAGVVTKEYSVFAKTSRLKKEMERFDDFAEKRLNDLRNKGVSAGDMRRLEGAKEELLNQLAAGAISYQSAKKEFDKATH